MFSGPFVGSKATYVKERMLIIGESHYSKDNNPAFSTDSVLKNYINNPSNSSYKFFHKIANSFGVDECDVKFEFNKFWDYVYFGNYVDELCGIKTSTAKTLIKNNQRTYNNELFNFINENQIKKIFVFSRLVYNNMPSLNPTTNETESVITNNLYVGTKRDWITKCNYFKNVSHGNTNILLNHDIEVFCMRHPSCRIGYDANNYRNTLNSIFRKIV